MAMSQSYGGWTLEMVHALPDDGNRYEVVDGELLVTPAPTFAHQRAALLLAPLLASYAESIGLAVAFAPYEVRIAGPGEVQPDIITFPFPSDPASTRFTALEDLTLAVEILSPNTAHEDRGRKRRLYQAGGVPEYWIVDLTRRVVERWRPDDDAAEVVTGLLSWKPNAREPELVIDLPALFRGVFRD